VAVEHEQRGGAPAHATGAVEFVALEDVASDETFRVRPDGDVSQLATSMGRLGQLAPVELRPWRGAASDGPRWQVVSGFRRLAAVRLLARERVLARLHRELSDDDAWGLALGEALLHEPLTGDELEALRERLREGGVAPWAEELVDEALVRAPVAAELRERFYDFLTGTEGEGESSLATGDSLPLPPLAGGGSGRGEGSDDARPSPRPSPFQGEGDETLRVENEDTVEMTPEELVTDLAARLSSLNQDLATAFEAWKDLPPEGRRQLVEQARYIGALLPFMEAEE
jgi:ParB-like nuclease domain